MHWIHVWVEPSVGPQGGTEMLDLKGKTALVTGASRGIGRGIAIALAEAGAARVALTYFQNQAAGADAIAVRYDQSSPQDTAEIFRAVRDRFGGLDVFVANARPDFDHFFAEPETIAPELFEHAFAAQARAFHTEARHAARVLGPGG